MNNRTEQKLIKINHEFYKTVGKYFDASRDYFWVGWEESLRHISKLFENKESIRILDVGCGNARFFEFMIKRFPDHQFRYTGIDQSEELLEKAEGRINKFQNERKGQTAEIKNVEIVKNSWDLDGKFDLIVMFGLMHHVPGQENRISLMKKAAKYLAQNGILIVTFWKFLDTDRLKRRILSKTDQDSIKIYNDLDINVDELEDNDYILDWHRGRLAYRYCHYVDDTESDMLIEKSDLNVVDKYRADAKELRVNQYIVLKKKVDN